MCAATQASVAAAAPADGPRRSAMHDASHPAAAALLSQAASASKRARGVDEGHLPFAVRLKWARRDSIPQCEGGEGAEREARELEQFGAEGERALALESFELVPLPAPASGQPSPELCIAAVSLLARLAQLPPDAVVTVTVPLLSDPGLLAGSSTRDALLDISLSEAQSRSLSEAQGRALGQT